jgi:hypothetical protein
MLRVSYRGRLVAYCHKVGEVARHIDLAMLEEVCVAPGPEVDSEVDKKVDKEVDREVDAEADTDRSRLGQARDRSPLIRQVR